MEHAQITTVDHCRQKITKEKRDPKGRKFEKGNIESIDDSPVSLFLPPLRGTTLLSWQMNTVVENWTSLFFVQTREFVIFLLHFLTYTFLEFFNPSQYY